MWTACPLHCAAAGPFGAMGNINFVSSRVIHSPLRYLARRMAPTVHFVPVPGSAPPACRTHSSHSFLTGTPSPWSAGHVICQPQHRCPPAATLYLPFHPGSIRTARSDCSWTALSAPYPTPRSSLCCSCITASHPPVAHMSTPPSCLLLNSSIPVPCGTSSYSISALASPVLLPTRLAASCHVCFPLPPAFAPARDNFAPDSATPRLPSHRFLKAKLLVFSEN